MTNRPALTVLTIFSLIKTLDSEANNLLIKQMYEVFFTIYCIAGTCINFLSHLTDIDLDR